MKVFRAIAGVVYTWCFGGMSACTLCFPLLLPPWCPAPLPGEKVNSAPGVQASAPREPQGSAPRVQHPGFPRGSMRSRGPSGPGSMGTRDQGPETRVHEVPLGSHGTQILFVEHDFICPRVELMAQIQISTYFTQNVLKFYMCF